MDADQSMLEPPLDQRAGVVRREPAPVRTRVAPVPPPDGLAVARIDGSSKWVKWMNLVPISQADTIYYEPR